jgi:hypothetical protein
LSLRAALDPLPLPAPDDNGSSPTTGMQKAKNRQQLALPVNGRASMKQKRPTPTRMPRGRVGHTFSSMLLKVKAKINAAYCCEPDSVRSKNAIMRAKAWYHCIRLLSSMGHGNRTRRSRLCKPLQARSSRSREAKSLPGEDEIAPLASERTPPFRRFAMTRGQLTRYDTRAVSPLSGYPSLRNGRWICSWPEPTPTRPGLPCPSSQHQVDLTPVADFMFDDMPDDPIQGEIITPRCFDYRGQLCFVQGCQVLLRAGVHRG